MGNGLAPALFLKGPDLLKGHAGLGRGHGKSQPLSSGVRAQCPPTGSGAAPSKGCLGFLLPHHNGVQLGLFPLEGPRGWGPYLPCPLERARARPREAPHNY